MSHKTKPLVLIQALSKAYAEIRTIVSQNSEVIGITKDSEYEIMIEDLDPDSDFKFLVTNPEMKDDFLMCGIAFAPENNRNRYFETLSVKIDQLHYHFSAWLETVKSYDITVNLDEDVLTSYQESYSKWFQLDDVDLDTKPFELEKQILLTQFINDTITVLEKGSEENKNLIEEAVAIRDSISSSVKSRVAKKLGRLFGKIHQKSLPLFKEVITELRKYAIKKFLDGSFEKITEFVHNHHLLG